MNPQNWTCVVEFRLHHWVCLSAKAAQLTFNVDWAACHATFSTQACVLNSIIALTCWNKRIKTIWLSIFLTQNCAGADGKLCWWRTTQELCKLNGDFLIFEHRLFMVGTCVLNSKHNNKENVIAIGEGGKYHDIHTMSSTYQQLIHHDPQGPYINSGSARHGVILVFVWLTLWRQVDDLGSHILCTKQKLG